MAPIRPPENATLADRLPSFQSPASGRVGWTTRGAWDLVRTTPGSA